VTFTKKLVLILLRRMMNFAHTKVLWDVQVVEKVKEVVLLLIRKIISWIPVVVLLIHMEMLNVFHLVMEPKTQIESIRSNTTNIVIQDVSKVLWGEVEM